MNNPNKTKLTQSEAARAAGVSHTSIWRAVRRGKLSAERADDGTIRIDRSELIRVYPRASSIRAGERSPDSVALNGEHTPEHASELHALRLFIEELQADKRRLIGELDREREERFRATTERERLLSMLETKDRLLTDERERPKRRLWWPWRRRAE